MEEENHLNPLSPAKNSHKSDKDQFATNKPRTSPIIISNHKKPSSKIVVYILLAVVLLSTTFLVFGLVVLRVKNPTLQLSTVTIKDLHYDASSLNMSIVAEIRVHNMNFGRFSFDGGHTTLSYGNATIGATSISDGVVGSREKTGMNVTVKVMKSNNELSTNFTRDVDLGLIKLMSFAKLGGRVRVVKIVDRHTTAVMNCMMDLNLTGQAIQDLSCHQGS